MEAKLVHYKDVPAKPVMMDGAKDVTIRLLIADDDCAPNFKMRRFTLGPGGHTPRHTHDWEHEVYVLDGEGHLWIGGKLRPLGAGMAAFIPAGEEHQFLAGEDKQLVFLCLIPKYGK